MTSFLPYSAGVWLLPLVAATVTGVAQAQVNQSPQKATPPAPLGWRIARHWRATSPIPPSRYNPGANQTTTWDGSADGGPMPKR
jgi:hypothetical protein